MRSAGKGNPTPLHVPPGPNTAPGGVRGRKRSTRVKRPNLKKITPRDSAATCVRSARALIVLGYGGETNYASPEWKRLMDGADAVARRPLGLFDQALVSNAYG